MGEWWDGRNGRECLTFKQLDRMASDWLIRLKGFWSVRARIVVKCNCVCVCVCRGVGCRPIRTWKIKIDDGLELLIVLCLLIEILNSLNAYKRFQFENQKFDKQSQQEWTLMVSVRPSVRPPPHSTMRINRNVLAGTHLIKSSNVCSMFIVRNCALPRATLNF